MRQRLELPLRQKLRHESLRQLSFRSWRARGFAKPGGPLVFIK
jgi:hypothetical protein